MLDSKSSILFYPFFFFSKATDLRLCRWSLTRRINTSRPITRWIQDDNGDIVGTVSREWVSRSSHVRRFSIFLLFFSPFEFPTRSRYLRYALLFHPSSLLSSFFPPSSLPSPCSGWNFERDHDCETSERCIERDAKWKFPFDISFLLRSIIFA